MSSISFRKYFTLVAIVTGMVSSQNASAQTFCNLEYVCETTCSINKKGNLVCSESCSTQEVCTETGGEGGGGGDMEQYCIRDEFTGETICLLQG